MHLYLRRTFVTSVSTIIASAGVATGLMYAVPQFVSFRRGRRRPSPLLDSNRGRNPFRAVLGEAYGLRLQNRPIPPERSGKGL